jgi:hypothetical protein
VELFQTQKFSGLISSAARSHLIEEARLNETTDSPKAVLRPDGIITQDSHGVKHAVASRWSSVFNLKPIDETALAFARANQPRINVTGVAPSSSRGIAKAMNIARRSSQRPDGAPYSSWQAAGAVGAQTCFSAAGVLERSHPPSWLSASYGVHPPKGRQEQDSVKVVRRERDTRALNFRKCDNETIASATHVQLIVPVATWAGHAAPKGGLLGGGTFSTTLRSLTPTPEFLISTRKLVPALMLWDFWAAFPSSACI